MTMSVRSINPRLISAVSPEPARLLAAAAAELARRWDNGSYDLGEAEAVADIGCIRDTIRSLAGLLDSDAGNQWCRNLYDCASGLASEEGRPISVHAAKRADEAHAAMAKAVRELNEMLDRHDQGLSW
jgi:hypothetical protein